ncbi:MAG TPA: transglycosylase SLT domain-containing protein [Polyangiaceae bacterium]|nr:transglycosylase SLT domain-containing protein [Polyangiaceae bacterium]
MAAWVLSLLFVLQPDAPWRASYPAPARAIAEAAERSEPLFPGPDGRARTAALLVAVAYHESRFDPKAVGDGGRSFGLFQLQRGGASNFTPAVAARRSLAFLRSSMNSCRDRAEDERLAAYASGRCDRGLEASRARMRLGRALVAGHPPPEPTRGAP